MQRRFFRSSTIRICRLFQQIPHRRKEGMFRHCLLISSMALAACDHQDQTVSACEQFTKATLFAPESYELTSASSFDQRAKISDFLTPVMTDLEKLALKDEAKEGLGLRITSLSYRADNGSGVQIDGHMECAFKTVGGKVSNNVDRDVEAAVANFRFRRIAEAQGAEFIPKKYPCCE